MKFQMIALFKW